ncbi:hypothetical protein IMZ08_02920 [Bacillus luteolus]|uniref:Lipoprotein n=1 Tax=Litchfieldia luteola TaxID=682179 RepID=A0ABR9QEU6_9BACI|nr:hypothetical protein [Cytobacillus luteolus]
MIIIITLLTACSFYHTELSNGNVGVVKEEEANSIDDEVILLYEQDIVYLMDGLENSETGFLNSSINQPYSIYLFKDFQLEAVTPHKDVLIHKENRDIHMEIELMPENINFFQLEYDTYKMLNNIVSKTVHRKVWDQPDPLLKGAVMLHAGNEEKSVQVILIKDRAHFPNMKLTIHTEEEIAINRLLAMAKTIVKTKMGR